MNCHICNLVSIQNNALAAGAGYAPANQQNRETMSENVIKNFKKWEETRFDSSDGIIISAKSLIEGQSNISLLANRIKETVQNLKLLPGYNSNRTFKGGANESEKADGFATVLVKNCQSISPSHNCKFEGMFKNGNINGHGTITDASGKISGVFENGILNGAVTIADLEDKIRFVGQFKDGKMAEGEVFDTAGTLVYSGTFNEDGRPSTGFGTWYLDASDEDTSGPSIYMGTWLDGKPSGKGLKTSFSGNEYVGDWVDGKMNGKGIMFYIDGSLYQGSWSEGKINGKGALAWSDNSSYQGHWLNGLKNGQGRYIWSNNTFYEGEWVNDEIQGLGKMVFADETINEGYWEKGVFVRPQDISLSRSTSSESFNISHLYVVAAEELADEESLQARSSLDYLREAAMALDNFHELFELAQQAALRESGDRSNNPAKRVKQ